MATAPATATDPTSDGVPPDGVSGPSGGGHSTVPDIEVRPVGSRSERRTREIGRELFDRIGRGPEPWQRAWWEDRFMAATLDDPLVRVQLFRFIDALPALEGRRVGPAAPGRISGRGGRPRPVVARAWRLRLAPAGSIARGMAGRGGAGRGRRDGPEVHRRGHARRGAGRPSWPSAASGWRSRPTCSARR